MDDNTYLQEGFAGMWTEDSQMADKEFRKKCFDANPG